ncbi:MAG TPA: ROK family protein [Gemmatimonadaceae bacterium]|nr:ROK family protein [Gemmatimonadaceae bacterium]
MVDTPTIIGIDVGGTKTAIVEGTTGGEVLQRSVMPTNGARPFIETFPTLAEHVGRTISVSQSIGRRPIAISVAVAGPLDAGVGRLLDPPNLPGWHDVPLTRTLERRFPALPVFVEHDAKAGALAEFRFGAGASRSGLRDMIFLTFGTGNGAGIIVGGQLARGANEMAGEVWAMPVAPDDSARLKTTEDGWESVSSGRGLLSIARRLYPSRWSSANRISDVVEAALGGDADALEVVNEAGLWLGAGLAVLVSVLNPQLIVIGSLACVLGDRLLVPARTVLARHALPRAVAACQIVPGRLGQRLGDVQSLMAAIVALGPL